MPPVHRRSLSLLLVLLAGMLSLAGCARAGQAPAPFAAEESVAVFATVPAEMAGAAPQAISRDSAPAAAAEPPLPQTSAALGEPARKIIKDAAFSLEVADATLALSRIGAAAAQAGGYVLETRTDFGRSDARSAVLRIAVPVEQFEATLERVRAVADKVLSEETSGVDVSQEFVDVQSQIANLEATQARIRAFLERAQTVEEALRVNAQLTEIEGQISQLKGRLQFLSQRAAFSTITVALQEPPVVAATPLPVAGWDPARVAGDAYGALEAIIQSIATVVIWLSIVVLPLLLPVILIGLIVRMLYRRARPAPVAERERA